MKRAEDKDPDKRDLWNLNPVEDENDWEDIESGNDRPEIIPGHNVRKNKVGAVVTNLAKLTRAKSSVAKKPNRILVSKQKRKQSNTSKATKGVRVHSTVQEDGASS